MDFDRLVRGDDRLIKRERFAVCLADLFDAPGERGRRLSVELIGVGCDCIFFRAVGRISILDELRAYHAWILNERVCQNREA